MKNSLSVVTIVKNEEINIEDFLKHLSWVPEIIVVDNGSTDNTLAIARRLTDKVFSYSENHFGRIKQFAVSKATGKWILVLDTDEFLSDALRKEIEQIIVSSSTFTGFKMLRIGHFLGHKLKGTTTYENKLRLFKRGWGTITDVLVHEEVMVKGKVGQLQGVLLHYSYRTIFQTILKLRKYAALEAILRHKSGERATLLKFLLNPLHMFWAVFIEDQGWKDGIWGFGLALCFAYYEFARYYYLLKIQLQKKQPAKK